LRSLDDQRLLPRRLSLIDQLRDERIHHSPIAGFKTLLFDALEECAKLRQPGFHMFSHVVTTARKPGPTQDMVMIGGSDLTLILIASD